MQLFCKLEFERPCQIQQFLDFCTEFGINYTLSNREIEKEEVIPFEEKLKRLGLKPFSRGYQVFLRMKELEPELKNMKMTEKIEKVAEDLGISCSVAEKGIWNAVRSIRKANTEYFRENHANDSYSVLVDKILS